MTHTMRIAQMIGMVGVSDQWGRRDIRAARAHVTP